MQDVRVAIAQTDPRLGDLRANLDEHGRIARRALELDARVVVFPELSLTGYVLRDQVPDLALPVDAPVLQPLRDLSREVDIVFGFVEEAPGHKFYNSAVYLSAGRALHLHRKLYLPTYGLFQEGRDFAAGDRLRPFRSPHGPSGLLICEDLWHPTCPWLLSQDGAEIIIVLSSGPTRGTRPDEGVTSTQVWRDLLTVTAQFQTAFVVYVNRVGCEDGLTFGGGSMVVDPFGRVVGSLPALEPGLTAVDLRGEVLRRSRTAYPLLRDENLELVARELGRIRRDRFGLAAPRRRTERSSGSGAKGPSTRRREPDR